MNYVMLVKYSSFHRQFFQVFTIASRLYHLEYWLAGRHRHLLSILKAEPFKIPKTSATTGTESSGTSGRQLKLIDYQLLVLSQPEKSHRVPLWFYLRSFWQRRPTTMLAFWMLILYRYAITFNNSSLVTWQNQKLPCDVCCGQPPLPVDGVVNLYQ